VEREQEKLFYGWIIVAVCFFINLVLIGLSIHAFTALVKQIEAELGWSRKAISAAMAIASLARS
jgi:hypothetical protein